MAEFVLGMIVGAFWWACVMQAMRALAEGESDG